MAEYRSPSTGLAVRAVLFDTFGTVVDWRSGIAQAVRHFAQRHGLTVDPLAFAADWRSRYQPAMEEVRSGRRKFVGLDMLHRENLEASLSAAGVRTERLPDQELWALARSWRWLPPWPDSVEGISVIKRHVIVGPLSNGNTGLLVEMAKFAGLPWDVVLGSDINRAYKPDPQAYLAPGRLLDLAPGEIMLVAAHNRDLAAAQQCGLATGFVARPHEHGPGQTDDGTSREQRRRKFGYGGARYVPVPRGLEVIGLARPMFMRTGHESCCQSALLSCG
ncbi:haloacid dehalogenase type II, partial [Mycobacterium sp. 1423905.2]|uniref:haloacid dehalogenase type II n=1 Tax=Mycobacterium sp. 1423905.2 TaxID=1856859 RepID=UPI0020A4970A